MEAVERRAMGEAAGKQGLRLMVLAHHVQESGLYPREVVECHWW